MDLDHIVWYCFTRFTVFRTNFIVMPEKSLFYGFEVSFERIFVLENISYLEAVKRFKR